MKSVPEDIETELSQYELVLLLRMLGARTMESFKNEDDAVSYYRIYRKLKLTKGILDDQQS